MLENALNHKMRRPGMSLDELYHSQDVEIYIRSVGRGSTDFRFHVQCVRDLIHFIDINQKTVSEFDFDRHQSLYNVIHEYNMYMERKKTRETILRKEKYEKERKLRIDTSAQENTKSQHKPCIMS
jgi:GTPase involved in cell partitioning and DNA repair